MTRAELLKIAKPILFNTEMVTAILEGRKTVTRRLVKPQQVIGLGCDKCPNNMPEEYIKQKEMLFKPWCDMSDNELISAIYKQAYQSGDILYVRETWCKGMIDSGEYPDGRSEWFVSQCEGEDDLILKAHMIHEGIDIEDVKWKPSIHMPKEAARIFLKVKSVRVERLKDITEEQATKEGCKAGSYEYKGAIFGQEDTEEWTAIEDFINLWNSTINKSDLELYGWDANPYVWVIEFERIEPEGE